MTAATVYMSLLGADGLANVAQNCHANTLALVEKLTAIPGVKKVFSAPNFHEAVIALPQPAAQVLEKLAAQNIQGGVNLGAYYDGLENCILLCATETKTAADLDKYAAALTAALK